MNLHRHSGVTMIVLGVALAGTAGQLATAAPPTPDPATEAMNTILKYNPGVSREEMTQSLQEYADANGESLTAVVEQNAADLKAYATTHDASSLGGKISPQSSGGGGTHPLPNAKVQGDIFWKASGFWIRLGPQGEPCMAG